MLQRLLKYADLAGAIAVVVVVVMMVVPLPPPIVDLVITVNVAGALAILVTTMYVPRALDFASFPSLLLLTTLLRLAINVSVSRLILLHADAGGVIHAFGNFVVGGNLVVGLVIFMILIVIQFVVITNGAGRVAEVAARFTLDAMPGKQMAIDADLNAGLITGEEARARREGIAREAEFYGAMDGAGKFVRGDAVAGLLIVVINLVGGVILGTLGGLDVASAMRRYAVLSVGDGLVTQIPALFIATAAGVVVTKTSTTSRLSRDMAMPFLTNPRALATGAAILGCIGFVPGIPLLPFLGAASVFLALWTQTRGVEAAKEEGKAPAPSAAGKGAEGEAGGDGKRVDDLLGVDRLGIEIGYRLIPLVEPGSGTGLLDHVAMLRRQFATQEGIVVPPVRIRDNMRLDPNGYRILVGGEEVATGKLQPGHLLAMDASGRAGALGGIATTDPVFGMPARWIPEAARADAELLGWTIVDPVSVLVTHLTETLRRHAHELLTRDDVKHLLETAKKRSPAVVEELVPGLLSIGDVQKVLRNLLRERVPLKNLSAVLEALADRAGETKDVHALTEAARSALGRAICERFAGPDGKLHAVTLDPALETRLVPLTGAAGVDAGAPPTAAFLRRVGDAATATITAASRSGREPVVLTRANLRRVVRDLVAPVAPRVPVLSYPEAQSARAVESAGVMKVSDESA
ncbi:MAG TPA: flagellar biosynthesis protein FlhA, partial [Planctomycetota bacterium]|nr:flagellar biosynthesis protein FlhA [Planctomycetota bacterium]